MRQTAEVKCPKCHTIQSEDINDLAMDAGEMEGSFPHACDNCRTVFTVEYQYKPFVKTYVKE